MPEMTDEQFQAMRAEVLAATIEALRNDDAFMTATREVSRLREELARIDAELALLKRAIRLGTGMRNF